MNLDGRVKSSSGSEDGIQVWVCKARTNLAEFVNEPWQLLESRDAFGAPGGSIRWKNWRAFAAQNNTNEAGRNYILQIDLIPVCAGFVSGPIFFLILEKDL